MKQGTLNVNTQDIFPIIKKFLYTDHEIFLRELISNATDAIQKLKVIAAKGESEVDLNDLKIEVILDKKKKTLTVKDNGIGMTAEEIDKYINQIAFSSAEEFVKKYEQSPDANVIIGHFGLGFYSSFMVADKVEIKTKSYLTDSKAVHWTCSGSTEYETTEIEKDERGTEIILHISKENKNFLEDAKISELLNKYCRYMPVDIIFGTEKIKEKTGEQDKDGKDIEKETEKPKVINNTKPLWTKNAKDIKDEEYLEFYRDLYPFSQPPLFWIHLNVDYPFHLTGILYFPKISANIELQKNKIRLFSNQVFVTDTVDAIVPEFLTLLHGVIDSPDIPLNVSRSSLQADNNVKKISAYIIRKVGDKLNELFKKEREEFEKKWDDIDIFVKYGMLTEDKFYEKATKFFLLKDSEEKYYTFEEYANLVNINQKDKDENIVWLYTTDPEEQYSYLETAKKKGYNVLLFNEALDAHFFNLLEQKFEKTRIKRIDSASFDDLIDKGDKKESVLSKENLEKIEALFKEVIADEKNMVKTEALSPDDPPVLITEDEFFRRMNEMSKVGGNMFGMGGMSPMYNVVINSNHSLAMKLAETEDEQQKKAIASQMYDLARLSKNILKGKDLNSFIERSLKNI